MRRQLLTEDGRPAPGLPLALPLLAAIGAAIWSWTGDEAGHAGSLPTEVVSAEPDLGPSAPPRRVAPVRPHAVRAALQPARTDQHPECRRARAGLAVSDRRCEAAAGRDRDHLSGHAAEGRRPSLHLHPARSGHRARCGDRQGSLALRRALRARVRPAAPDLPRRDLLAGSGTRRGRALRRAGLSADGRCAADRARRKVRRGLHLLRRRGYAPSRERDALHPGRLLLFHLPARGGRRPDHHRRRGQRQFLGLFAVGRDPGLRCQHRGAPVELGQRQPRQDRPHRLDERRDLYRKFAQLLVGLLGR